MVANDFKKELSKRFLLDGIGSLSNLLPVLLIESSGFYSEENIEHTLGDCLKNIKSSSDTLKFFISNYKNASFTTMQLVHI